MESRYAQSQRQYIKTLVEIVALSSVLAKSQEREQQKKITIQTKEEFQFYLMLLGAYGGLGKLAAWSTIMRYPELAVYVGNEESVARQQEPKPIAELGRDRFGFVQQTAPQINATNNHGPAEKKPYSANPYSYTKYSATNLKSAFKKVYTGIED